MCVVTTPLPQRPMPSRVRSELANGAPHYDRLCAALGYDPNYMNGMDGPVHGASTTATKEKGTTNNGGATMSFVVSYCSAHVSSFVYGTLTLM